MKVIAGFGFLAFSVFFLACTEGRVKRYQGMLDPKLGSAKKTEINKILGSPTSCTTHEGGMESCEYRTASGRNDSVPDTYRKQEGVPDLSPYEYFDVLQLQYDGFGVFKDWQPVVIAP